MTGAASGTGTPGGPTGLDPRRAAEVISTCATGIERGSGYLVTDHLVLTAAHVVDEAVSIQVRFNADRPGEWSAPVEPVWTDSSLDIAVLRIAGSPPARPAPAAETVPVRFGRILRPPVDCETLGFPLFKLREDPEHALADGAASQYRDSEHASGTATSWSNLREGTMTLTVPAPERNPVPTRSPWEGMSGAAVWSGHNLIGVVGKHHLGDGLGALAAYPVDHWYEYLDDERLAVLADLIGLPDRRDRLFDVSAGIVAGTNAGNSTSAPLPNVPRELPLDVSRFTGRTAELEQLDALLAEAGEQPTVAVISAVSGTAGVGKTALAVHWAHLLRRRGPDPFVDGCLYLDLRGYDPGEPMEPGEALGALLRSLGLTDDEIPREPAERASRYRSLLDGRRMLVVLDNARDTEQVRPLLPGASSCFVLVTSRDDLAGLIVQYGATAIDLDLLPAEDAMALLRALLGNARVDGDPAGAAALARICVRLPLALRIAAAHAATRRGVPLTDLVAEIAREQRRLDVFKAGADPRTAMRVVFSWSYRHLGDDAARAFRLAGLHPGRSMDTFAIAALTDLALPEAKQVVDALVRAHLFVDAGSDVLGMHDLLRRYASELTAQQDSEADQRAALTRLFDHYLYGAAESMDILYPHERARRPRIAVPETPVRPIADPDAALNWLSTEHSNLMEMADYASGHGWPSHVGDLAVTLGRHLDNIGRYDDALMIHLAALRARRETGDRAGEAHALGNVGNVYAMTGRHAEALDYFEHALATARELGDRAEESRMLDNLGNLYDQMGRRAQSLSHHLQALAIAREIGDRPSEGRIVGNLGVVCWMLGRYGEAVDYYQRSLDIIREVGDRPGEGRALSNLAGVYAQLGRYEEAHELLQQALAIARETASRVDEAYALSNLGSIYELAADHEEACEFLEQALTIHRETGNPQGEGSALTEIAAAYTGLGRYEEALGLHRSALAIAREIGDPDLEIKTLNYLAHTLHASGRSDEALETYETALAAAGESEELYEYARALDGIAQVRRAKGQVDEARRRWREALERFTYLGVPQAQEVRASLAALDG